MIKSLEIKKNISIKILKNNNSDKSIILIESLNSNLNLNLTSGVKKGVGVGVGVQFFISKSEIYIKDRIIISDKKTINRINQGIEDLNIWNKRKLILKGVGSRCEIENGELKIKVSNTLKKFKLLKDINVKILNNPLTLVIWGINMNTVDKFKNDIIKAYPKLKNYEIKNL